MAHGNDHHGFKCVSDPNQNLPKPTFLSNATVYNATTKNVKFFGGVLPTCYGYDNEDWKYEVTAKEDFEIDADVEQEYTLYIKSNKVIKQKSHAKFQLS